MKNVIITSLIVLMVLGVGVTFAETGNGAPSGAHFTLNIHGVKADQEKNMDDCDSGNRIFVKLGEAAKNGKPASTASTDIWLVNCENVPEPGANVGCMDFGVLDCDGTDGDATFMLPNPDPGDDSGCTKYSVYIRALGSPKGLPEATITTCGERCTEWDLTDPLNPVCVTWERVCSLESVDLQRTKGKQIFQDVSKELLTMCICVDWDLTDPLNPVCLDYDRIYIFDPMFENYLWEYDNSGLKHVQMRFYYEPSCPDEDDPWNCP